MKFRNIRQKGAVSPEYYLSQGYLNTLKKHKERERSKGNNFGYRIVEDNDYASTLLTGGAGKEMNLVHHPMNGSFTPPKHRKTPLNKEHIRRMTPREWARLMGFPQRYKFIEAGTSDTQAYTQLANAVCVPVIKALGLEVVRAIRKKKNDWQR
tara:strand:- start:434 stop:892 length:459 start_codon:yes stop_codon:yes gene_type:complete